MIGPHQIEADLIVVFCLEKAFVDTIFEKRLVVVPVPVENHNTVVPSLVYGGRMTQGVEPS